MMMTIPDVPLVVDAAFLLTAVGAIVLLAKALHASRILWIGAAVWILLQSVLALSGFYRVTDSVPPRFLLLLGPPFVLIALTFALPKGRTMIDGADLRMLTLFHTIRIPVELVLLALADCRFVPPLMTMHGGNWDIVSGVTAPFAAFVLVRGTSVRRIPLLLWNIVCLVLLLNVMVRGVLSAPSPFQRFAIDSPNLLPLTFPYILLPGLLVPMVLFAHLVSLRRLLRDTDR